MLSLTNAHRDAIVATCIRALPNEGCGLLLGRSDGTVIDVVPGRNVAGSAKLYEIDSLDVLRAQRRAEELDGEIIGVFHSHTHSDAFPSPTDVVQAPDPEWHYLIASLRQSPTVLRSFHIAQGDIVEEVVTIVDV